MEHFCPIIALPIFSIEDGSVLPLSLCVLHGWGWGWGYKSETTHAVSMFARIIIDNVGQ